EAAEVLPPGLDHGLRRDVRAFEPYAIAFAIERSKALQRIKQMAALHVQIKRFERHGAHFQCVDRMRPKRLVTRMGAVIRLRGHSDRSWLSALARADGIG